MSKNIPDELRRIHDELEARQRSTEAFMQLYAVVVVVTWIVILILNHWGI